MTIVWCLFLASFKMDASEFRKRGKEMVDFVADYMENIEARRVLPEVSPGYLREVLPNSAPSKSEDWRSIMKDVDRAIMPGVSACSDVVVIHLRVICVKLASTADNHIDTGLILSSFSRIA